MTSQPLPPRPLILIFPFGYLSHYLRCLALCRPLSETFDIRFAAHPSYQSFVEEAGYATFHVARMDDAKILEAVRHFDFSWLQEDTLEEVFLSQVTVIRELKPVAVLGDAMPTLSMAAEYCGTAFVALANAYMTPYYAGLRRLPRTHPASALLFRLPARMQVWMTRFGEQVSLRSVHRPFRKLRARYSLRPARNYLDEFEGDLNLICDLPALFPLRPLPSEYLCIGPQFYAPARLVGEDWSFLPKDKRIILVSLGSTGDWTKLGFLSDSRYARYHIITAGDAKEQVKGDHVTGRGFVDLDQLLPFTDLVICHGGNGTIYQALKHGVPVLCLPVHFEQEWNVDRLSIAGLGSSLSEMEEKNIGDVIDSWIGRKQDPLFADIQLEIRQFMAAGDLVRERLTLLLAGSR